MNESIIQSDQCSQYISSSSEMMKRSFLSKAYIVFWIQIIFYSTYIFIVSVTESLFNILESYWALSISVIVGMVLFIMSVFLICSPEIFHQSKCEYIMVPLQTLLVMYMVGIIGVYNNIHLIMIIFGIILVNVFIYIVYLVQTCIPYRHTFCYSITSIVNILTASILYYSHIQWNEFIIILTISTIYLFYILYESSVVLSDSKYHIVFTKDNWYMATLHFHFDIFYILCFY